ncbi:MAG: hypothetical protein WBB82_14350, partial [Limnothrix sp.]
MAVLHGNWIFQGQQSYFFLWSELWRSGSDITPPQHPFCGDRPDLEAQLKNYDITLPEATEWQTTTFSLPSKKATKTKSAFPLLSNQETIPGKSTLCIEAWDISGFALNARQTTKILGQLPLNNENLAGDLRFWWQVCRWSLDLVIRRKFLPNLVQLEDGQYLANWVPLLDSVT